MTSEKVHVLSWRQNFDLTDFSFRWYRARLSAFASVGSGNLEQTLSKDFTRVEHALLQNIYTPEDCEKILKAVFDQSRKLGLSLSKKLGLLFEPSDFKYLLSNVGSPCLSGQWSSQVGVTSDGCENPITLTRPGCAEVKQVGSFYCDYWREALDGLVMGLGETERLARHRSAGHGDDFCQDVIFSESNEISVPVRKNDENTRYGPMPAAWMENLEKVRSRFEASRIFVDFKGFSEGTIYFSIKSNEGPLCGSGGSLIRKALEEEVKNKIAFNGPLKDVSPLAVLGTGV